MTKSSAIRREQYELSTRCSRTPATKRRSYRYTVLSPPAAVTGVFGMLIIFRICAEYVVRTVTDFRPDPSFSIERSTA